MCLLAGQCYLALLLKWLFCINSGNTHAPSIQPDIKTARTSRFIKVEMSKEINNKFDVIIVGGGIVGLTIALLLVRNLAENRPLKLALVDGQKKAHKEEQKEAGVTAKVNSFNARVSALTLASQSLFDSLGLWQKDIAPHACPYEDMYVWDAEGTGNINFSALDIQQT